MKRRFQIYMRMVDFSFWVTAVFLARFVAKAFGHPLFVPTETGSTVLRTIVFSNVALAIFIVLARFMRDEHAERIWQLTARRFVNAMVTGCALMAMLLPVIEERFDHFVASRNWPLPPEFGIEKFSINQAMMKGMVGGFGFAIMIFGFFAPLIFVVLYRWALWRDSR